MLKTLRRQRISTLCSLRTEKTRKNLQNVITHSIFNIETSNKTRIIEIKMRDKTIPYIFESGKPAYYNNTITDRFTLHQNVILSLFMS